jgi:hypothetical protein
MIIIHNDLMTAIANSKPEILRDFELFQNYPNPFNPKTVISWQLAAGGAVQLSLHNSAGQRIAVLINQIQPAGFHSFEFDGSQLASGVYLYRLNAEDFVQTRKMVLLK